MRSSFFLFIFILTAGCGRDETQVWQTNYHTMCHLVSEITQIGFEHNATNVANAITLLTNREPNALAMFGSGGNYLVNPKWLDCSNEPNSDVVVIMTPVMLKHGQSKGYLGVTFGLKPVELEKPAFSTTDALDRAK